MNENLEIRIRKDLRPLSNAELIEMILFLINTSVLSGRYSMPGGYDMPLVVRSIQIETIEKSIRKLLRENEKLLAELETLRKSPPGTSMTTIGILSKLEHNANKYKQLSQKLEALEAQQV